jgi:hypothetical protein
VFLNLHKRKNGGGDEISFIFFFDRVFGDYDFFAYFTGIAFLEIFHSHRSGNLGSVFYFTETGFSVAVIYDKVDFRSGGGAVEMDAVFFELSF